MAHYLVEANYEEEKTLYVFSSAEDLARFLSDNIETEHYTGNADQIEGVYLWQTPPAPPVRLQVAYTDQDADEADHLYWHYEIRNGEEVICEFTVTIDGRA